VEGHLDGKLYLEHTLAEPVAGRIGLWSKADSHVYFDGYTVVPAAIPASPTPKKNPDAGAMH
jgi:hypothetical protein